MAKSKSPIVDTDQPAARPRLDPYVLMLFVTFVALVTGSVLMYLDYDEYGSQVPPDPFREKAASPPKLGEGKRPEGKIDPSAMPKGPATPTPPMGEMPPDPMGGMPMFPMGGMPMFPMGGAPMGP